MVLGKTGVVRAQYSHKASHPDGQCGCGPCYSPRWLQWFRWPPLIVAYIWVVGVVVLSNNSYFGATLSTIERQFGLSSTQSTFLATVNDLASVFVTVFIAFFSERTSRPIWVMVCLLCMALGNLMTALPHFLSDPLDTDALTEGRLTTVTAKGSTDEQERLCLHNATLPTSNGTCTDAPVGFGGLLYWALAGQLLIGIGQAGWSPILIPYFDDLAGRDRRRYVVYYAIYASIYVGSGSVGFLLGGTVLNYYVDFERISPDKIPTFPQSDPRWIGAWWMGFMFVAAYLFLAAIPITLLPKDPSVNMVMKAVETKGGSTIGRELKDDLHGQVESPNGQADNSNGQVDNSNGMDNSNGQVDNSNSQVDGTNGHVGNHQETKRQEDIAMKETFVDNVKAFPPVLKRIAGRPVLVLTIIFNVIELSSVAIFQQFIVKYLKTQFAISGNRASFIKAAIMIPSSLGGVYISSFLCRQFKFTLKQCALYITFNNLVTVVALAIGIFIGCKNPTVVGVNQPYTSSPGNVACNADCSCAENVFNPVCAGNGISYLSSCNAGCLVVANDTTGSAYTECACVNSMGNMISPEALEGDEFGSVDRGLCDREAGCETQLIYMLIIIGVLSYTRMADNPMISVIQLGSSEKEIRTTVYGLQKFFTSLLGFFPTPIYFGAIVNSTCALWQYVCGERASCWLYDTDKLRYALFGINIGFRIIQLPVCILIFLTVKESLGKGTNKRHAEDKNEIETTTQVQ